jgi:hypothetical protein
MIQLHLWNVNGIRVATQNCHSMSAAHTALEYLSTEGRWSRIEFADFETGTLLETWIRPEKN